MDGKGNESIPLWRDEFSVSKAGEQYVNRRQLAKFLTLTSLGMFAGNVWIVVRSWLHTAPVYAASVVAHAGEIPVGGVKLLEYPKPGEQCILVRTAEELVAISIPDFSPLPGAAPFGTPMHLCARIDAFNDIARSESASRVFRYVDITAISREANHGDRWIAGDGLHPGPAQHRAFADRIWPVIAPAWKMARH